MMGKPGTPISRWQRARIIRMHREGFDNQEIAKAAECDRQTVRRFLQEWKATEESEGDDAT